MSNKDVLKKSYIINKNQFSTNHYNFMTEDLGLWEKIHCQYIKIFDNTKLQNFYFDCRLKKYTKEVKLDNPTWYNEETKQLTYGFAADLYILLKNIFLIQPILEETFASINKNQELSQRPLPIEFVFHTLLTHSSMESYPFTIQNLSKDIDVSQKSRISQINTEKIETYLKDIAIVNFIDIDEEYAEWLALYKVYDVGILEFVRRFYSYVSLDQEVVGPIPWSAVSISAVRNYLAELYNIINSITMTDEGLSVLMVLQESLAEYNSKKIQLSKNQIITAWQNISSIIKKFQKDDAIFKLVMIAYHDPSMGREVAHRKYDISEQFQQEMPKRVSQLSQMISSQVISNNIKGIVEKTNKFFISKIVEIGIYTSENSDKVETLKLNRFSYVTLFATIRLWLLQFVNTWFLPFINFLLAENVLTLVNKDKLDKLYKKLYDFTKGFDRFYDQVQPQLIANKKMMLFLQGAKISEGEKHLVKILVNDFNDRAELLVKELRPILTELYDFTILMIADLQDDTSIIFKKIEVVKQSNIDLEKKLKVFLEICEQLCQMLK